MTSEDRMDRSVRRADVDRLRVGRLVGIFALAFLSVLSFGFTPTAAAAAPPSAPLAAAPVAPAAVPAPASSQFLPPCYPINTTVCISIANSNETDIIPPTNSFYATVEPNTSTDLPLVVKAKEQLDWTPAPPKNGPNTPITLNLTAVTWNGDPYYSPYDGDVWHSDTNTFWEGPSRVLTNKSGYTWWYYVNITAKAANGAPNFLPGMSVTWWITLTHNSSGVYNHVLGPQLHYTYSQAWPYSPYPGAGQDVAGGGATFEDVNLTVSPQSPNWNDSVNLVLNTTQADVQANATIGSAYADLTETAPSGQLIQSGTINFPVSVGASAFGATSSIAVIPASYAQVAGAIVTYRLTATDVPGDQLVTPTYTYTVGANGSFLSGIFLDDINVATTPGVVLSQSPLGQLNPGQGVNLTITSRNPGTAISSAAVYYQVSFPLLHEKVSESAAFKRVSSTIFTGKIPGLPIGSFVNFTVDAWDFTQRLEVSPTIEYTTPDFTTYLPTGVPANSSFFYVLVFDNGTQTWVSGATVQVTGPGGFFNSQGNSTYGLYYPNETTGAYLPLMVPANVTYTITVTDPYFVFDRSSVGPISITITAYHSLGARQTLVQASNYEIVQEQNIFLFYLNSTPPLPTNSPTAVSTVGSTALSGVTLLAIAGIVAFSVTSVFLYRWWSQIRCAPEGGGAEGDAVSAPSRLLAIALVGSSSSAAPPDSPWRRDLTRSSPALPR